MSASARDGWEEVRVLVVEPMGSESLVTLHRSGQRIVARVNSDLVLAAERPAWIFLPPERTLTFDKDGQRIRSTLKSQLPR